MQSNQYMQSGARTAYEAVGKFHGAVQRKLFEGDVEGSVGEARGARILAGAPRGRGVGFLSEDVNSAAKARHAARPRPDPASPRLVPTLANSWRNNLVLARPLGQSKTVTNTNKKLAGKGA